MENIDISYMWQNHYAIRVPRSFSLKFRGDVYNYYMLQCSKTLKVYADFRNGNDVVKLLKDKYNRLWYHVYWEDGFDDRIEEDPMEETPGYIENKRNEIILLN